MAELTAGRRIFEGILIAVIAGLIVFFVTHWPPSQSTDSNQSLRPPPSYPQLSVTPTPTRSSAPSPRPTTTRRPAPVVAATEAPIAPPAPQSLSLASYENRNKYTVAMSDDHEFGDLAINGKQFANAIYLHCGIACGGTQEEYTDFNVGRAWTTFTARAGVGDQSASDLSERIEIYGDGRLLYGHDFMLGQSQDIRLNVKGVLRLRFKTIGENSYRVWAALGEPTVRR